MSSVPMLSPDGKMGDVPHEGVQAAIKAGFKIGADLISPDGRTGIVPLDRVHDAINAGFRLQGAALAGPHRDDVIPSPTPTLADTAEGAAKSIYQVSAPGIATSLLEKNAPRAAAFIPQEMRSAATPAEHLPAQILTTAIPMMVGDEVPARAAESTPAPAPRPSPEAAAPSRVPGMLARFAGRFAARRIPGVGLAMDIADALGKGTQGEAPAAARPPVPQTEGTPWGQRILKKTSPAETPAKGAPVYRDATRQNAPFAGEAPPVTKAAPVTPAEAASPKPLRGAAAMAQNAKLQRQAESLRQPVNDVVAEALADAPKGKQMLAQIEVDFYLKKGNLEKAQSVFDKATGKPSDFPPPAPTISGSTNDIRANLPENRAKVRANLMEDKAIQQEMGQNLDQHGWMAESEARKEFIARNSTGVTKAELVRAAGGVVKEYPVKYTKTPGVKPAPLPEDLTDILKRSLELAKRGKAE